MDSHTTDRSDEGGMKESRRRSGAPRGEVLSEFDAGSDHFRVELRGHDLWGVEVLVFQNGALLYRRRFYTRELAEQWAHDQRAELQRGNSN